MALAVSRGVLHLVAWSAIPLVGCAALHAQPQPAAALENSGKPIVLPFQCTADDIHWAGMACSEDEPCPVYLELTATDSSGVRVFAAGNIHSESVTLYSVLLASEDGGLTWREVHPRLRGAGLDRVQFLDTATGWVGGEILFPLSQDPFLLATTDGGRVWQRQPLFSETTRGSLQQFLFTSRTHGSAVVDKESGTSRYALYESADGGRTWAFREESDRAPRLSGSPTAPPTWRVRAEASTQAYHVERLDGERWTSVAAFAVALKACRPGAPEDPTEASGAVAPAAAPR
jgi:hypothetical protein